MDRLLKSLDEEFQESARLEGIIKRNLKDLGYGD